MTEAEASALLAMADEWDGYHCQHWKYAAAQLRSVVVTLTDPEAIDRV